MYSQLGIRTEFITPTEINLQGGTPGFIPTTEGESHTPVGVLLGKFTLEQTIAERQKFGDYFGVVADQVGRSGGWRPLIKLQEIDVNTGQTLKDPAIYALWDGKTEEIKELSDEESHRLTSEMYITYAKQTRMQGDMNLYLREPWKSIVEGSSQTPENRG